MTVPIVSAVVLLLIGGIILYFTRKAGKDAATAQQGIDNANAASRVADATAKSPDTLEQLRKQLSDGSGKL